MLKYGDLISEWDEDRGLRIEDPGSRIEDRGSRIEDRGRERGRRRELRM